MANSSHPSLRLSDRNERSKTKNKTRGTRYSDVANLRVITGSEKTKNLKNWPLSQNINETYEIQPPMFSQNQFLQYPQQIPQSVYPQQISQSMYPQQSPQSIYPQQMQHPGMYLQSQMPQPEYLQSQIPSPGYIFNPVPQINIESYDHSQIELSPTFKESASNLLNENKAENLPRRQRGRRKRNNKNDTYWPKPVDTSASHSSTSGLFMRKRNRYRRKQNYEPISSQKIKFEKYNWYSKKYKRAFDKLSNTMMDNLDEVSDGPLEDEDFEEVEVASGSDDNKSNDISVGFRKSKPLYLKGKAFGFFKPKVVTFSPGKIFVKCTNAENKEDIEELVDLVSDADEVYPDLEVVNPNLEDVNLDLEDVNLELEDVNSDLEDVNPDLEDVNPDLEDVSPDFEDVKPDLEDVIPDLEDANPDLEDNFDPEVVNLDLEDVSDPEVVNLDLEDVSDAEYEEVGGDGDEFLNENMLIIDDDEEDLEQNVSSIVEKELEEPQIIEKQLCVSKEPAKHSESSQPATHSEEKQIAKPSESKQPSKPSKSKQPAKSYKTKEPAKLSESKQSAICKTATDLYQGKAVFEDSLDNWNSHLIGLEYILEIWDTPGGHVQNYHCTLCDEDISIPKSFISNEFIAVHVSNIKHMSSYIEKHFPSCGYKLTDDGPNIGSNVLENCCKDLKSKFVRKSIFITNSGYLKKNLKTIKSVLDKASHWTEKEFMLDILKFKPKQEVVPIQQDLKKSDSSSVTSKEIMEEVKEVCETSKTNVEEKPEVKENLKVKEGGVESVIENLVNIVTDKTGSVSNAVNDCKSSETTKNEITVIEKEGTEKDSENKTNVTGKGRRPRRLPVPKLPSYQLLFKASQVGSKPTNKVSKNPGSQISITDGLQAPSLNTEKKTDTKKASQADNKSNKTDKKLVSRKPLTKVIQPSLLIAKKSAKMINNDLPVVKDSKSSEENLSVLVKPGGKVMKPSVSAELKKKFQQKSRMTKKKTSLVMVKSDKDVMIVKPSVSVGLIKKYQQQKSNPIMKKTSLIHSKQCLKRLYKKTNTTTVSHDSAQSKIGTDIEADVLISSTETEKDESKHLKSEHLEKPTPEKSTGAFRLKISPKLIKVTVAATKGIHSDLHKHRLKEPTKKHIKNRSRSPLENVAKNLVEKHFESLDKKKGHDVKSSEIEKNMPKSLNQKLLKSYDRKQSISPGKLSRTVDQHRSRSPRRHRHGSSSKHSISSSRRTSRSPIKQSSSSSHNVSNRLKKPDDENSAHSKSSSYRQLKSTQRSRSPKEHRARNPVSHKSRSPKRETIGSRLDKEETIGSKLDRYSNIPTDERHTRIASEKMPLTKEFGSNIDKHSRSPLRKHSRSPLRKQSRSPLRKQSRSPIRKHSRSPIRRHSRSPIRRHSRSPIKRYSRSPVRRYSKSPSRRYLRSPVRRYSKSPSRRYVRSPIRRYSKSPRRFSRSPLRRKSRSPIRRRSRSPFRKHSRNVGRKHSRSPARRRSRSSERYSRSLERLLSSIDSVSRSTFDGHLKSPFERASRSPHGRHSLSPRAQRSVSPYRRYSKSSVESISITSLGPARRSRSPIRKRMRSPGRNYSSPEEINSRSVSRKQSRSPDIILLEEHKNTRYVQRVRTPDKDQYVSYGKLSQNKRQRGREGRPLDDLEEISDDEEFSYFNSKEKISGTTEFKKLPHAHKMLILKILQGISVSDLDHNDPSIQKMIQFFRSNKEELQQFISQNVILPTPSGMPDAHPQSHLPMHSRAGFGQQQMPVNSGVNLFPPSSSQTQPTFPFSPNYPPPQKGIVPVPNAFANQQRLPFPQQNQPAWAPPNQMPPNQLPMPPNQHHMPPNQFSMPPNQLQVPPNQMHIPPNQHQMPPNQMHMPPNQHQMPPNQHQMPPNQHQMPPNQLQMPPNHMHIPPNQIPMGPNQFQMQPNQFQMPMNQLQMPPPGHMMDKKMHQPPPQSREEIAARQQKMAQEQLNMFFQGNLATPTKSSTPSDAIFKDFRATVSKLFGPKKSEKKDVSPMVSGSQLGEFKHHGSGFKKSGKSPSNDFDYRSVKSVTKTEHKDHSLSFSEQIRQKDEGNLSFPPPDAKVAFCDTPRIVHQQTLFPVVSEAGSSKDNYQLRQENSARIIDTKVSMAQRLASVLIKIGMTDVPGHLLQEMLMKIGAFSSCPPQDITETDIIYILRKCGYMR